MSDFQPTHISKGGVEVMVYNTGRDYRDTRFRDGQEFPFCHESFAAIFEPIPKPKMVTITKETAEVIRGFLLLSTERPSKTLSELNDAIAAAEKEQVKP